MSNFDFLVIGAGRGGTSLLDACLNQHSQLVMGYEAFHGELMGIREEHTDFSRIFEQRSEAFLRRCEEEAARHLPRRWGNKITTEQLYRLEDHNEFNPPYVDLLSRFFGEVLGGKKIVCIIRDGRSCIASKVRRTRQSWLVATFRWRYSIHVYRYFRLLHENNICLKFEDLLLEPEKELQRICGFLGLPFEKSLLHGAQNEIMPSMYRQDGFVKEKAEPADVPQDVLRCIENDLAYCGYE